ncbi:oligosaccharide flippase family protein [Patescibacteria group bacterium]|nr:oligosaccharide flippase family protein [Patescibacteria group bacterium]MBU1931067.1 oligosaccharide flippase family protein [Patescibacteria group bacterium]
MKTVFEKIISNTFFSFGSWILTALTSFITAPLIIKHLGFELYGLWATFFIYVGVLNLVDLGFGVVLIRNVAALKPEERQQRLGPFISLAFIYYGLVFLAASAVAYWAWQPIVNLLNIEPVFWPTARLLFRLAAVYFLVERCHLMFVAIFNGLQKMYLAAIGTSIANLGFLLGAVWMVMNSRGLVTLAWILLANYGLVLLYDILALKRINYNGFKWVFPRVKQVKQFLSFGFQVQLTITMDQLNIQLFKLLVSTLFGLQILAFYELAFRLVAFLQSLTKLVLPAVFPAAAEIAVRKDKERIFNLTQKGSRYLIVLTGLFYIGAIFLANDFFLFWLKQDLPLVIWAVRLLLLGYFGNTIVGIVAVVLMSAKHVGTQLRYVFLFTSFNLGFGFLLGRFFGFKPMLASLSLAAMVALPTLLSGFAVKIKALPVGFWWQNLSKVLLAAFSSGLLIYWLGLVLPPVSLATFLLKGMVFVFSYFGFLYIYRFFNAEDKLVLGRLLKLASRKKLTSQEAD